MKAIDGGIKVERPARVERKDNKPNNNQQKNFNKNNNQRFEKRSDNQRFDRKPKQEEDLAAKLLALQNKFKR